MFSFFKKKPVVLNFYTTHKAIFEEARPTKGVEQLPNWWKQLTNSVWHDGVGHPMSTAKRCVGITSLYKKAIIFPMPCDASIELGPIGSDFFRWSTAHGGVTITEHPQQQRGTYLPDAQYKHLKIESPWFAQCDEDVEFMFFQPTYNFEKPEDLVIPPAVVNFKYQGALHVNTFVPRRNENVRLLLEAGQPIAGVVPLTDRAVELKFHLVPQETLDNMVRNITTFSNSYTRHKAKMNGGKCPVRGA